MIEHQSKSIDLMTTKEILEYLSKERYSSLISIGVLKGNRDNVLEVNGCLNGKESEIDALLDELIPKIEDLLTYYD
jgi:hypothetical protein